MSAAGSGSEGSPKRTVLTLALHPCRATTNGGLELAGGGSSCTARNPTKDRRRARGGGRTPAVNMAEAAAGGAGSIDNSSFKSNTRAHKLLDVNDPTFPARHCTVTLVDVVGSPGNISGVIRCEVTERAFQASGVFVSLKVTERLRHGACPGAWWQFCADLVALRRTTLCRQRNCGHRASCDLRRGFPSNTKSTRVVRLRPALEDASRTGGGRLEDTSGLQSVGVEDTQRCEGVPSSWS